MTWFDLETKIECPKCKKEMLGWSSEIAGSYHVCSDFRTCHYRYPINENSALETIEMTNKSLKVRKNEIKEEMERYHALYG